MTVEGGGGGEGLESQLIIRALSGHSGTLLRAVEIWLESQYSTIGNFHGRSV